MSEERNETPAPNADGRSAEQGATGSGSSFRRRRRTSLGAQATPRPAGEAAGTAGEQTQRSTLDGEERPAQGGSREPPELHDQTLILPREREAAAGRRSERSTSATGNTKATEETGAEEEIPPARRAVRLLLMSAIVVVAGYVVWSMADEGETRRGIMKQLARGPRPAPKRDTSKGERWAADLEKLLVAGRVREAVARARQAAERDPESPALLRVRFKAEAVQAVRALAEKLDKLPQPRLRDAAVPVKENIAVLEKRLVHLRALDEYRRDWRRELLEVPAAGEIYARFGAEMENAPAVLANLRTGEAFLRRALAALDGRRPDFDKCASALRSAWTYLRLPELVRTAGDCRHLSRALYLLGHHVIDQAVEQLKQAHLEDAAGGKKKPVTLLARVRARLAAPWRKAREKVGAWDELNRALAHCKKLHARGRTGEALTVIAAALPKADPDNLLTRDLVKKLLALREHYARIQHAWMQAQKAKQQKPLKQQLAAWARFQRLLREGDGFHRAALRKELLAIKQTIVTRIEKEYAGLQRAEAGFTPITLQMRKPQNPRAPFARAAAQLARMAAAAQRITAVADLVPNWKLGSKTEARVEHARNILADLNDQARKLHNLYKLYQRLGKLAVARECLERVRLLGDSPSNPWYQEAVKILGGK